MVGQVLTSTAASASLDLSSRVMACVVSTHADLLTCRAQGLKAQVRLGAWERTAHGPTVRSALPVVVPAYLHNHLDGGKCGGEVLGVRGPHSDGHAATVQAAVEGGNEVHPWGDTWSEGVSGSKAALHVQGHGSTRKTRGLTCCA